MFTLNCRAPRIRRKVNIPDTQTVEVRVNRTGRQRRLLYHSRGHHWRFLLRWTIYCAIILSPCAASFTRAESKTPARNQAGSLPDAWVDFLPIKLTVVDRQDIRFRRLSGSTGLSQTRVSSAAQDNLGFIWFGTQYGLNRYDGYRSKVYKHEPGRSHSLSCVYIRSLFVDHSGTLWVGCDRFLDKFDPITETFTHYRVDTQDPRRMPALVTQISEDHSGMLWLATARGLYSFDPATGHTIRYAHDPTDLTSIAGNDVKFTGEDRTGQFWIADSGGLDAFDRKKGKVTRHVPFPSEIGQFHQDQAGVFWITSTSFSCPLATLDLKTNHVTCHSIYYKSHGVTSPVKIYTMLESRDGTVWLGSMQAGLLKIDREHKQIITYHNHPADNESLGSDDVISIFQDKEGDMWICLQETEPYLFAERAQVFENFTYQRGSLVNPLVTTIYEDHNGVLWIASMGGLNRIDRRTGRNTAPAGSGFGNEIMSMIEDRSGALLAGTFQRLQRLDPETGKLSPYARSGEPSTLHKIAIQCLMFDHQGTLWAATYGGVSRFDPATGNFVTYTPDKENTVLFQAIKEDSKGILWLGAQSGLYRFDPRTGQFMLFEHDPDAPSSLSDNRVNSVHFDRTGGMWLGTQNGLDKFDPGTGTFKVYLEQDGLAGNVVSCILEDKRGHLWMGTNNGLSSFDPQTQEFQNFSAADGLPGPDLTGWGSCFKSPNGEMFFGGFSGATAFYPSQLVSSSFVPRTVLTDFRLSGNPVPIGSDSPLHKSITYTDSITLSHQQNIFSIEFSALSYFNAATNRYRYKLEGLDNQWHEVGSDQRTANYTTLPAGTYIFHVQGVTSRGTWSEPGAKLRIEILPPWWNSLWFRVTYSVLLLLLVSGVYFYRVRQRRRAEEEHEKLRQAQADLMHLNRVSTMGELTASLAHEIKQPIAAAVTDARTCLRWLGRDQPDMAEAGEAASRMIKDVTRASDIISRISSLFKKESPQRELLDVNEVVQEMIALLRAEASRYSIAIDGDLANEPPRIMADRVQLQQVLMNLMLNGIEAIKDMGAPGKLTIQTQQAEDHQVLISVTDTGVGLPPEKEEQIFNAFFTTKRGGTGMGLAISRSIIDSHGGRLWATSNPGSGATFQFTLPGKVTVHDVA
jgi:signal transduction histidine kinase/ligand-binding sensor domain-containing protein